MLKNMLILVFLGFSLSAFASSMVPAGYNGTIKYNNMEGMLFFDEGREDLILKIDYKINGRIMPESFAWVITLPSEPDHYGTLDRKLFVETFDWANPLVTPESRSGGATFGRSRPKTGTGGTTFGKLARVGPYEIQPIRAQGSKALETLNKWLFDNNFPLESKRHMKYFTDNDFTFLCIKVLPSKGETVVDTSGELPPLHLSFKTKQPYYPLRFSSRQGEFGITLYLLTGKKLDYLQCGHTLAKLNWTSKQLKPNVAVKAYDFPYELSRAYRKSTFKEDRKKAWHLNVVRTRDTNKFNSLRRLKEDAFFPTVK